jgi:hypothetical protein
MRRPSEDYLLGVLPALDLGSSTIVSRMDDVAGADSRRYPRRFVIGNALEWVLQPERRGFPGSKPPSAGEPYPDDDMALFWSGDDKVVVTRHPMGRLFVDDCRSILGYQNVSSASPKSEVLGNFICGEIASSERLLHEVIELLDGPESEPILVEAYGSTPEYGRLVAALRARSPRAVADCMTPADRQRYIPILDSKIRVREFFDVAMSSHSSPARLTRAFTARGAPELHGYAESALPLLGPLMIKADFGFGGHAMALIDNVKSLGEQLAELIHQNYDCEFLIEEHIGSGGDTISLCYTGVVGQDGEITTSSVGRELQYSVRFYAGAHIGLGSMPAAYTESVRRAGEAVGKVISSFGYRGSFTLDLICRETDSSLFLLEVNPRQALPSTLGDICIQLFGPDYGNKVSAIARRWIPVHPSIAEYSKLRDFLIGKGLFGREERDLVILPYMVNSLARSSVIGLAVAGTDNGAIEAALDEIQNRLAKG